MRDRTEALIVELVGDEPRHGIVRSGRGPISVSWLPTGRVPAGGIELADHVYNDEPAVRDAAISEAEAILERGVFPGEGPNPDRNR
jgi:hypothetical protein